MIPAHAREVLEARARALARPPAPARPAGAGVEVVFFALGTERYAVEARFVREVARVADLAPVPGLPDFVMGVANLRGEILAVMDLRRILGVPAAGLTDLARLVVLGADRPEFGILADSVSEVATLRADEILEPPASVAGVGREFLKGVTREALIVLDGAVLLRDPRLFVGAERRGAAGPA